MVLIKKAEAKAQGNPAMSQAHKTIIVSGYGFWGLRTKDRDGTVICSKNSNEYLQYLNTEKLINFKEHDVQSLVMHGFAYMV